MKSTFFYQHQRLNYPHVHYLPGLLDSAKPSVGLIYKYTVKYSDPCLPIFLQYNLPSLPINSSRCKSVRYITFQTVRITFVPPMEVNNCFQLSFLSNVVQLVKAEWEYYLPCKEIYGKPSGTLQHEYFSTTKLCYGTTKIFYSAVTLAMVL